MAKYIYKARDLTGKIVSDTVEAASQREAVEKLKSLRYVIVDIKEEAKEKSAGSIIKKLLPFGKKVKSMDVTLFSRQLATLISSGVPLVQGLSILEEQIESPQFKKVIKSLRTDIESGISISEAMKKHPDVFSELYIGMVHAGEIGGILDQVLDRLASYLEASEELKSKIKGAMTYPILVTLVAIGAATVMLTVVVPRFAAMFSEMGAKLPTPTLILINVSNFLKKYIGFFIIGAVAFYVIFRKIYKSVPSVKLKVDIHLLRLPVLGDVIKKTAIAKFTRTLGTLVKSGVPILQAMETVAKTTGNKLIEKSILEVKDSVREGERIAEPLKKKLDVFPPMVVQMISVGEETGQLDTMLFKIADFYDKEVSAAVEALTGMIEPLIIVFLGLVVGGMVVAMYLPMFEISSAIGG
jgi:type IV pilus assembly protein PilC